MNIQAVRENSVTFKITNENGVDSVGIFVDIIAKCATESKKKGFKNMFNSNEKKFLLDFAEQLKEENELYET